MIQSTCCKASIVTNDEGTAEVCGECGKVYMLIPKDEHPDEAEVSAAEPSIIYVDLDGVLADYDRRAQEHEERCRQEDGNMPDKWHRVEDRFYLKLKPIEGAIEAFHRLCGMDHTDVYILSSPSWTNEQSWTDKRIWVEDHLGDVAERKLILSHEKGLLQRDVLIDDQVHPGFDGEHIHFGHEPFETWDDVLTYIEEQEYKV